MKYLPVFLAAGALAALSSGCATNRDGYLYDARAPRKSSVVFKNESSTRGTLVAQLADGERCTGNFNTVPGIVQTDEETGRVDREESQAGMAILACNAGHVVRCDFQRDHSGAGYGHCADTAGHEFDLYF